MGLEGPDKGTFDRDCEVMEERMAEFLAIVLGAGVVAILTGMARHAVKQREFQRRIKSAMERYDLDINK